jgi:hypothetical protein
MKMPLEGFRRVSKDEKFTTLKHRDGHEMTINHSILSPKMRGEIEALPQSDKPEKFKDGGGILAKDAKAPSPGEFGDSTKGSFGDTAKPVAPVTDEDTKINTAYQPKQDPPDQAEKDRVKANKKYQEDTYGASYDEGGFVAAPLNIDIGSATAPKPDAPEDKPVSAKADPMEGAKNITPSAGGVDDSGGGLGALVGEGMLAAKGGKIKKYAEGTPKGTVKAGSEDHKEGNLTESKDLDRVSDKSEEGLKQPSDIALPKEEEDAQKSLDFSVPSLIDDATKDVQGVSQEPAQPYDHGKAMIDAHNAMSNAHNTAMQLYAASQQQPQSSQQQSQVPQQTQPQQSGQQPVQPQQPVQQTGQQPAPTGSIDQQRANTQNKINERDSYVQGQEQKNQQMAQAVFTDNIDPRRLFKNDDTFTTILRGIGLGLGGLGAPATGGRNMVVDTINHAIERDIDAQKADQSNHMNLYKANLEATRDAGEARNQTIQQMLSGMSGMIAKKGLENNTALSQAQVAKLNQEIQGLRISNSQNQYLMNQLKGSGAEFGQDPNSESAFQNKMNTLRMLKPDFAKDLEAKYLPGVGVASVPLQPKDRDKLVASKVLSKKLAELENFSRQNSGTLLDPAIKAQGHALANDVISSYRIATDQGVFKPSDQAFLEKSLPMDPTAFFAKYRTIPAYQEVRRLTNETANQIQKSYGVKPFSSGQTNQDSGIKTMGGIPYQLGQDGQYHRVK